MKFDRQSAHLVYDAFISVHIPAKVTDDKPITIHLEAAIDNANEDDDLPLALSNCFCVSRFMLKPAAMVLCLLTSPFLFGPLPSPLTLQ